MAEEDGEDQTGNRAFIRAGITGAALVSVAALYGIMTSDGETNATTTRNTVTQTITASTTPQSAAPQSTTTSPRPSATSSRTSSATSQPATSEYDAGAADAGTMYYPDVPAPGTVTQTVTVAIAPPTTSATIQQSGSEFPSDEHGFVNSKARCEATATVVARTQQSLLVVCPTGNGGYEYRGVRLNDGAVMILPAQVLSEGGYVAANGGVKYVVTRYQLVVTADGAVQRREEMLDFRQPGSVQSQPAPQVQTSTTVAPPAATPQPGR